MWTEQDYRETLEDLMNTSARARAIILESLIEDPSGDPRLIPHLERCLNDRVVTRLWIPLTFGEVRWRAAEALAEEWRAQGNPQPVTLSDAFVPMTVDAIITLAAQRLDWSFRGGPSDPDDKMISAYTALRDQGILKPQEVVFGS